MAVLPEVMVASLVETKDDIGSEQIRATDRGTVSDERGAVDKADPADN